MIPYGISDFRDIKLNNYYYIDKTHFISKVESYGRYLFFIRPRRFGKSLFLNMLALYYDIYFKDEFDAVFGDCYIANHKTKEASSYYILKFDFSAVSTKGDINDNFNSYCNIRIEHFIKKYKFDIEIHRDRPVHENLNIIFSELRLLNVPLYIMIDEYDNFINNILMHDEHDYEKLVSSKDEALYKEFFKLLKAGTTDNASSLKKMFITGVSPLAMFDVTSGSNIGTNITNELAFYDAVGINQNELSQIFSHYDLEKEQSKIDEWYNHYKFHEEVEETIYNTDMILYYIKSIVLTGKPPRNLIDLNVRTDYSKLRYLVYTNNQLNGNFNTLQRLFGDGHVTSLALKDSFSAFEMKNSDNFTSLLYYLGLTTIEKVARGEYYFKIPNQTIRIIMAEYIQKALTENKIFNINLIEFQKTIQEFAYDKSLGMFNYLAHEIEEKTKVRDYIDGENFIKGFLIAYLSLSPFYAVLTEEERNKGFVDIYLKKAPNITDDIVEAIIELKYIPRSKFSQTKLSEQITQATQQIKRYGLKASEKGIVIIFSGWEMVYCGFVQVKL
ncbi:MAG: ATP-binding protein [Epsilonproteobacteria bacterium]|nr:ATP-binding protein [Campylobacterota bacterium]